MTLSEDRSSSKLPVVLWLVSVAAVCYLSLVPKVEFPLEFENADLMYHTLAYLWLAFIPSFAFPQSKAGLLCSLAMVPLGFGLEVGQTLVPERVFSFLDLGANALGAVLGIVLGSRARTLTRFLQ